MVVGVERNPAMQAAEEAVAWAKAPSRVNPAVANYEALKLDVERIVRTTDAGTPVVTRISVPLAMAHWACLSRMLVMDEPALSARIHPQYSEALDSQAGAAWLQLMFAAVTGRRPKVRSWRHARGAVAR